MGLAKSMMVENGRRLYRGENCGAGGGDRTRTPLSGHGILSPGRLPIPPPRLCWGKTRACFCASTTVSSTPSNRTRGARTGGRSEADTQSEPGHHVRTCSTSGVQIREVKEKGGGHREPPIQSVLKADPNREQPGGIGLAKVRMD